MNAYAGIGSRSTPHDVLKLMRTIGAWQANRGYILRSGAADGADSAFETGARAVNESLIEIYLPWPWFNQHPSSLDTPHPDAFEMATQFHPNWGACSPAARKLHARNCHQILGRNLDDPVKFVCCWTRGAAGGGGTGQALRLAQHHNIKIYDLADPAIRDHIEQRMNHAF